VYIEYDNIFNHYKFRVSNAELRRYAKRKTLLVFHVNLTGLNKWFQHCLKIIFQSKYKLDREIDTVKSNL